jgi:low temperature requirement protein LtrA
LMNVDRRDDITQRALMFLQMFLIFILTLEFVDRSVTNPDLIGLIFAAAVFVLALAYHRVVNNEGGTGDWARGRRNRLILAGFLMIAAFIIPDGVAFIIWGVAIMLLIVPMSATRSRGLPTEALDEHHLTERAALLTLVVIGEAFLSDISAIVVLFVILFALFSIYFDDIPRAGIRSGILAGEAWLLSHLVLQLGVIAFAIGMSKYLQVADQGHVQHYAIIILCVAFIGIFGGLAGIGLLGNRKPKEPLLVLRVVTVVLAVGGAFVAWYVTVVSPVVYVIFLMVLGIAHAFIDEFLQRRTTVPMHSGIAPGESVIEISYDEENQ